jgi:hypothetical protein
LGLKVALFSFTGVQGPGTGIFAHGPVLVGEFGFLESQAPGQQGVVFGVVLEPDDEVHVERFVGAQKLLIVGGHTRIPVLRIEMDLGEPVFERPGHGVGGVVFASPSLFIDAGVGEETVLRRTRQNSQMTMQTEAEPGQHLIVRVVNDGDDYVA